MSDHSLRYIDNGSFFTRMDALNKLVWVVFVIVITFQLQSNMARGIMLGLLVVITIVFARIPFKSVWQASPIILVMGALLFVVNLFTTPSTSYIEIAGFAFGQQGFERGVEFFLRITIMVLASFIFIWTTDIRDLMNRPTSQIDALGRVTTITYGPYLDPITLVDPLNRLTTRTYGSHGEQLSETDPASRTTSYAYDAYGNQTLITNALGDAQVTAYDLVGRPVHTIDPLKRSTTLIYDLADRLLQATGPTGHSVAYAYDGVGNQTIITDAVGHVHAL